MVTIIIIKVLSSNVKAKASKCGLVPLTCALTHRCFDPCTTPLCIFRPSALSAVVSRGPHPLLLFVDDDDDVYYYNRWRLKLEGETAHKATDILRRRWRAICCYFRFTFSVFHARQKAETVINPKPSNRAFAFGYNRERERAVYSRGKPSTCG